MNALERAQRTQHEDSMLHQLRHYIRPQLLWQREFRFHPKRMWRFDLACVDRMLAIECEGATWANGRHNRGYGYENDCVKYAEAAILGWTVLRFTADMIADGRGLDLVSRWIEARS